MAVEKEPMRTCPAGADSSSSASSRWAEASSASMRSAVSASTRPASVSTAPVGARSSTRTPASFSSSLICWLTAEGVRCWESAAATMPPARWTASRTDSREGVILM